MKTIEEMAKVIYREWFVDFRAPGIKLRKSMPEERRLTGRDVFPERWRVVRYAELLTSFTGGDWGEEEPNEADDSRVVIVRGADFKDIRTGGMPDTPVRFIARASLEKRELREGDLLVENSVNASSRSAGSSILISKGVLGRIGAPAVCASFCKNFRLKNRSVAPLVLLHLKHLHSGGRMAFYQHVATNGIANFQAQRFVASEGIPMPEDSVELERILGVLAGLTASTYADQSYLLRQTRDVLLPRLISGEVSVEDVEITPADDPVPEVAEHK
jgi:type I restriction enzyme S subunit